MFTHHCSSCEKRQLIFPSQVTGVAHAPAGQLAYTFTCWCGSEQAHVMAPAVVAA